MFDCFREDRIRGDGATLFVRHGGDPAAPPLLLLHGYPQSSAMWHPIAPRLARDYHVICPDLRGYGRSDKPAGGADHAAYSKRAMARDLIAVMDHFGHDRFVVAAHDRGARVAHRMGLDHPDRVRAAAILDIAPTREMYARTDRAFATAYWHWFFLIQPAPLPERMIEADPDGFWTMQTIGLSAGASPFSDAATEEYRTAFRDPAMIHAACEDYRAAAGIDIRHDDQDGGRKLPMPVLILWGRRGVIERCFDPLALWQDRAAHVEAATVNAGHFLVEEAPDAVLAELAPFLARHATA
ncbi:MAG: alpha/beta hydrolase [Rhodobacteraceae bacterium]|nr:alpha/beta hydrolase [Paracoccaceae bacterium]